MKTKGWTACIVLLLTVTGCGVVGPPVPPGSIGVNVKRRADAVEQKRRTSEAQQRQPGGEQGPQGPAEPPSSLLEGPPLQDEVVQPSARPDSDFLVRPR